MSRAQRISVVALFFLIGTLSFFWAIQVEPGFFARNFLAALYTDLQNHSLNIPFRGNVPGLKPLLAILHLVTDIPVDDLAYLPLGAFLRGLIYFAIIHSITRNKVAASAFALMTAVYPWVGWGYSSVFVHSLGAPLFFTAVLVCLFGVRRKLCWKDFTILILVLLGLHFFDYTAEVWLIVMFFALMMIGVICENGNVSQGFIRPSSFAVLAILGSMFFWTKYTSLTYIGMITKLNPLSALIGYISPSAANTESLYGYERTTSGLGLSTYFYLLVFLAVVTYCAIIGYQAIRERSINFTDEEYVIGAMVFAGGGGTFLYLFLGRFTQYFIAVGGPLIALICVYFFSDRISSLSLQASTVVSVFAVLLLIIVSVETGVLISNGNYSQKSPAVIEPGAEWLFTHSAQPSVLAGLSSRGLMRMPEARNDANVNWSVYTAKRYSHVVEGDPVSVEFVAADFATKWGTQSTGGWKRFESLRKYRSNIRANNHLNAVYSSGTFVIYHSKKS